MTDLMFQNTRDIHYGLGPISYLIFTRQSRNYPTRHSLRIPYLGALSLLTDGCASDELSTGYYRVLPKRAVLLPPTALPRLLDP